MKACSAQRATLAAGALLIWWVTAGAALAADGGPQPAVSGQLVDGVREVEVAAAAQDQRLTVYRGDYVRFRLTGRTRSRRFRSPRSPSSGSRRPAGRPT